MRRVTCGVVVQGREAAPASGRRARAAVRRVGAVVVALLAVTACHRAGRSERSAAGSVAAAGDAPWTRGEGAGAADATAVLASARGDAHIIALLRAASDGEVRSGAAAIARAVNPDVTAYAQQMINAHTALDARLRDFALMHQLEPRLPDQALPQRQAREMSALAPLAGASFDQAFAAQQLHAHRRALALVEGARTRATSAALRAFLTDSVAPSMTAHLRGAEFLVQRLTRPDSL